LSGGLTRANKIMVPAGRFLARFADAVIVQSKQMAALVQGANAHIIPHEIDFGTFSPTERVEARTILGLDPSKRYLLFAAKPENGVKNFALAKAAFDEVRLDDPDVELL